MGGSHGLEWSHLLGPDLEVLPVLSPVPVGTLVNSGLAKVAVTIVFLSTRLTVTGSGFPTAVCLGESYGSSGAIVSFLDLE